MKCRCFSLVLCVMCGYGSAYGMRALLKSAKKCNAGRSIALVKQGERQNNNLLAWWTMRAYRSEYKNLKHTLTNYVRLQDLHMLNIELDCAIAREKQLENPDIPKILAVFLSRLKPENFAALVVMNSRNSLWKQSYAWDGIVLDTFFNNMELFEKDKVYEILNLVVRYKPRNFALYNWCYKNIDRAYDYIGYDGLKAVYNAAFDYEKHYLENAYRVAQKELYKKDRRLYFLDEKIKFDDWRQGDNC